MSADSFFLNSYREIGSHQGNDLQIVDIKSNDYVPVLFAKNFHQDDTNFLYYKLPTFGSFHYEANSTRNIIRALQSRSDLARMLTADDKALFFCNGLVFSESKKVLLSLSIKREAFLQNIDVYGHFCDDHPRFAGYDDMILFISSEFATNPSYSAIYKRLQKAYIDFCYLKGVEVRVISSQKIEENTFANEFKLDFNSILELDYCLKNEVKYLLTKPKEYFYNHLLFDKQATMPITIDSRSILNYGNLEENGYAHYSRMPGLFLEDFPEPVFEEIVVEEELEDLPF